MSGVEDLRRQLRERGYLSHGIERWFALDPWSSRAFWVELITVALKAATLIAAFGALPHVAILLFRNAPVGAWETFGLFLLYALAWLAGAFVFVVVIALVLKLRPELAVDTPRALLAISFLAAAALTGAIALWWYRFDASPTLGELLSGVLLCAIFFLVATIVVSAALLSFSIYELQRIPALHQKPRGVPMALAAAGLIALLFVPAYAARDRQLIEPMVVTTPTTRRVVLIAVDGMTDEIFHSRSELVRSFGLAIPVRPIAGASTAERWASVGTGVTTEAHGVRAIEGVRFRGGRHLLQRLSRGDFVLHDLAPLLGIARREPLPPTVRRRDYVWEILARRGIPSLAVDWWTTADSHEGALESVSQATIFTASHGDAARLDELASQRFLAGLGRAQFATVYLPALDVVLNRVPLDPSTRLATSLRVLDRIGETFHAVRARGYDVVLVGMPGEGQEGSAIVASTFGLARPKSTWDVAPTVLDILGFPLSDEMPGRSLATKAPPRIPSYGNRQTSQAATQLNDEYYQNLKSLGYIR